MRATGTFDVKLAPLPFRDDVAGAPLGRMSLDKRFHGDLDAGSKGEMLSAGAPATGSAGYVAVELVSGTLHGRGGTFILQHSATMARGVGRMTIVVVPSSGTGDLAGIEGSMTIEIDGGRHSYIFEYTLPAAPATSDSQ